MPRISAAVATALGCALLWPGAGRGQSGRGPAEWMTDGGDAQRSSWIRSDPKISVANLGKPGFELVWKVKLGQEPGIAATLDRYIGYRGFRSLALMGSAVGELTAIDTDLGRIEWNKTMVSGAAPRRVSDGCTGGMTANVTRPTTAAFPSAPPAGRGGGRSQYAKSAVGEPGEGAVTIAEIAARNAAAAAGRAAMLGRGPVPPPPGRTVSLLDAIASDGTFHSLYVSNGEESSPALPFVPAGANAHGLIVVNGMAYAATSHACGGAPNGIWALDLTSREVVHWAPSSDLAGFALGPDATIYATTTAGELVALEAKNLQVKATYRAGDQAFTAAPVAFEYKMKIMVAGLTKDGRMHLVDAASLAGAAYPATTASELATWQDPTGTRWILASSNDSITAWKVGGDGDSPFLQPGWTSREVASPMSPVVVNGVVFAVSNASTAVLYAFDGASGKELWNSGKTIAARVGYSGLSASGSRVYVGAADRTIYAFGFPIEH